MNQLLAYLFLLVPLWASAADVQPADLRCEHLGDPVGIDVTLPRLSWRMEDAAHVPGRKQTAYRVLVASSKQQLDKDQGDLWDSGKVSSSQSHLVSYAGKPLGSHTECHWKVKLWTGDGPETPWSPAARFTIGLLEPSDWQGPWMTYGADPETNQPVPREKHLWFRHNLELGQAPASAIIHIASIGYHELYVNGTKADDRVLAPTLTRLNRRVHYVSYDIARLLRAGTNCIGIHYGPGWARYSFFNTSPAIRVQLHGTTPDGQGISLSSGKDWRYRVAASENTGKWEWGNNGGERMDARRLVPDWNLPGHDVSTWAKAVATQKNITLSAEMIPPSRVIVSVPTVEITDAGKAENGDPLHQVLLEKNFTGFLRIKVRGQASGDRIVITVADAPSPNSVFNQISEYICTGEKEEEFQHRFNYCAGRYLSIQGLKQKPRPEDITGLAISNALERVGSFSCSNGLFNRIYETDVWTFLANTTEGFTADCPHRERMGYGEVAFATSWGIGLPNFQSGAFYAKVVRDWADVQEGKGWIHHTAPQTNKHDGGAMWSSAGLNVAAETYLHHGDPRVLEANHASAKRWLEFLHQNVKDDLLTSYNKDSGKFLGDWAAPGGRNEGGNSPEAKFFNNCVYAKNLADFIHHSKVLGREEGIAVYQERLDHLLARIHREFYQPETASYAKGTQVQQAFALLTGVCPPDLRDKVRENLFNDIQKRGFLDMGSSGLPVLLKYMIEQSGRSELLADPLSRTTMPGYGFFLEQGQTTWPEHWQPRTSNIHTCYTGIASWFIKSVGGIRPDPAHPGFQKFLIQPVLAGDLTHARASTESPYGVIVSEWRRKGNALTLDVEIPPNASATVHVPTSEPELFRKKVSGLKGVTFLRLEPKRAIVQLEAGRYSLESSWPGFGQ
jgi:alpha-L-rhamnosidase